LFRCIAFASAPLKSHAKATLKDRVKKGIMEKAGKDRFDKPLSLYEDETFFSKVSIKDTDGDFYIFDSHV